MFDLREFLIACALLAILTAPPIGAALSATQFPETSIILICWDGVKRDHLFSLLSQGRMPNATRLASEGTLMNLTVEGHVTETTPGHVEMLTGYSPNVTGAYSNLVYSVIPANLTAFERLEGHFGDVGIATVMLTGKPLVIEYITDPSQYEVINWTMDETHPFYNARSSVDFMDLNRANASVVGAKALDYLDGLKEGRSFIFIHFREPDAAGHNFGENSAEYDEAIVECDRWLGILIAELESEGVYNRTVIYVTTDHGFDEGGYGHSSAPEIWLFTNDPHINASMAAYQRDIVPTIFTKFGMDPLSFSPQLLGRSLTAPPNTFQGYPLEGIATYLVVAIALIIAAAIAAILVKKRGSSPSSAT